MGAGSATEADGARVWCAFSSSLCLSVSFSLSLSVCLSLSLSICLSVSLSLCLYSLYSLSLPHLTKVFVIREWRLAQERCSLLVCLSQMLEVSGPRGLDETRRAPLQHPLQLRLV